METERPILIFDGVCNLCNFWVDFMITRDPKGKVVYAANQGETGRSILEKFNRPVQEVNTLYFYENGQLYDRSAAVLRAARLLKFPWNMFSGLRIVPLFIRNIVYNFFAQNRYKWFGKKDTCRLPSPDERARFLD